SVGAGAYDGWPVSNVYTRPATHRGGSVRSWYRTAAFSAVLLAAGLTTSAVAHAGDQPTTLYVRNAAGCSDTGNGSQATPFCTPQVAADLVNPGQTIQIDGTSAVGGYGPLRLTRSGTPDAPITVVGTFNNLSSTAVGGGGSTPAVLTLT